MYIDNFYTSYELAISCLNRKTHVVGTLKNNKKFIPKDIPQCKPKKGEMVSKEDSNGIVVLKWRDSRDVRILSTKHAPIMVPSTKNIRNIHAGSTRQESTSEKLKPLVVLNASLSNANKRSHTNRSEARENVKKTTTFYPDCPDKPQLCIECFKTFHCKQFF